MVKAVLMSLMLLPLLGMASWQASQLDPSIQQREVAVDAHSGEISDQPAGWGHTDISPHETQLRHPETSNETDRAAQRARAIEKKDPALLPFCTDNEWTNRPAPVLPRSFDPWEFPEQLGCLLQPPRVRIRPFWVRAVNQALLNQSQGEMYISLDRTIGAHPVGA